MSYYYFVYDCRFAVMLSILLVVVFSARRLFGWTARQIAPQSIWRSMPGLTGGTFEGEEDGCMLHLPCSTTMSSMAEEAFIQSSISRFQVESASPNFFLQAVDDE